MRTPPADAGRSPNSTEDMIANASDQSAARDNGAPTQPGQSSSNPERWVDDHGDFLFSYAVFRLRDAAKAKDAVQETLLAAWKNRGGYAGRSSERGWLLGILKHKIHDAYRLASRETSLTDLGFFEIEEQQQFVAKGLHEGAWIHNRGPRQWAGDAGENLDREEFWQTFRACAAKLPKNIARVFLMRTVDGVEAKTICADLNISENNLWVMLHRARMALRRCLETNWFGASQRGSHSAKNHSEAK